MSRVDNVLNNVCVCVWQWESDKDDGGITWHVHGGERITGAWRRTQVSTSNVDGDVDLTAFNYRTLPPSHSLSLDFAYIADHSLATH